jgi:hypothetical protein
MPQPVDCPGWEYNTIPGYDAVLKTRNTELLNLIRAADPADAESAAKDTRSFHREYFTDLTPDGFDYYAGNYRGDNFRCLLNYEVYIRGDPRVGHAPNAIQAEMQEFSDLIAEIFRQLDMIWSADDGTYSQEWKLHRSIQLAAYAFVLFLEIHPYANGNGHMGRLLVIAILARYNVFFSSWAVHPRPIDPPYTLLIASYRAGNTTGLELFLLSCL